MILGEAKVRHYCRLSCSAISSVRLGRAFAKDLEENVNPAFDNLLRIYWKHYPICTDCVPGLKRNLHPHACKAAYAAEAARLQQGNDGFWKTHDYLFANPKLFVNKDKEIDWGAVATALEMDVDRFLSDMQSEQVRKRVDEDVEKPNVSKSTRRRRYSWEIGRFAATCSPTSRLSRRSRKTSCTKGRRF